MRKILFIITMLSLGIAIYGQNYNASNSLSRVALVSYYMDENGYYKKKENVNLQVVSTVSSTYGYDKKSHELYVETDKANCIVTVNDDFHKILKKSKSIPQLKSEELAAKANAVNQELAEKFERLNVARQKHIADSIERVRQDSVRKAREDSIRVAQAKEKLDNYVANHKWFLIPTSKKIKPYCAFCEKSIEVDTLNILAIKNDSIFWDDSEWGYLFNLYDHIHAAKIPESLKSDYAYNYHCTAFADTIQAKSANFSTNVARVLNAKAFLEYIAELRKDAPNGFFIDWGWDNEYSSLSFNFEYMNTNSKTIKYIEVFFVVLNDVGDVRKTGYFKGTGPVEEWQSGSWSWDHSSYYVAGDATKMNISKVIITYTNGAKVTIPKNKLKFN